VAKLKKDAESRSSKSQSQAAREAAQQELESLKSLEERLDYNLRLLTRAQQSRHPSKPKLFKRPKTRQRAPTRP
jgi:hypothetical protein